MLRKMLPLCLALVVTLAAPWVQARVATMRVQKITTDMATLEGVTMRLAWADDAQSGDLHLQVGALHAPTLGYHFQQLEWHCPLLKTADAGWQCSGQVRSGTARPLQLSVQFSDAGLQAYVAQGATKVTVKNAASSPDRTQIILQQVPLLWSQALLSHVWQEASWGSGTVSGQLQLHTPEKAPMQVTGVLDVQQLGLSNADASIAAENINAVLQLDYKSSSQHTQMALNTQLQGGEFLVGNTYVPLPETPVTMYLLAEQREAAGWAIPVLKWQDGSTLHADASLLLDTDLQIQTLQIEAVSADMAALAPRYLSGWMGVLGLSELGLRGGVQLGAQLDEAGLSQLNIKLDDVHIDDPAARFVFEHLQGDIRYSSSVPINSKLHWASGQLYGLSFGAAALPFSSANGLLQVQEQVRMPLMGGMLGLEDIQIRPPRADTGLDVRFALQLDDVDFGRVASALALPAFKGVLGGRIPKAHYANDRIEFDGGLSIQLFEGRVDFSALSLERPFGTAPSLNADITMQGLDLLRLTEVLDVGSVTGRMNGHIAQLRLLDWTPVAFDAYFITDAVRGVKQRISQRAVQNISSVGDASFITSLQGKLIGIFSDFGYRRIGIGCKLENEVCTMYGVQHSGQHQAERAFTIVEGKGVPRLNVVGYNRQVDWPTLIERVQSVSKGDIAPVID